MIKFENKATTRSLRLIGKENKTYYSIGGNIGRGCLYLEVEKDGRRLESKETTTNELLKRFEKSNLKDFENQLYLIEDLVKLQKEKRIKEELLKKWIDNRIIESENNLIDTDYLSVIKGKDKNEEWEERENNNFEAGVISGLKELEKEFLK